MSPKASLARAGALAAAATIAGISPALSHTVIGQRVFPATLEIDDPGVNDELAVPSFAYVPNPDGSNLYSFAFEWQKTITADLSFFIGNTFNHLTNTLLFTNPVTGFPTFGTLNGWGNIDTQLRYSFLISPEHEFVTSASIHAEIGNTGDVGSGFADKFTKLTVSGYFGKGFGDVEAEWLRPIAVTGEIDYSWSTHPIDVTVDPTSGLPVISQIPTVLTYGGTLQYSLLYMNSFVHEVPEFFRHLIPDIEFAFATPVSNIGPSSIFSVPGTHETTGTWGPGLYYLGRLGPVSFQLGAVAAIPINRASGRHVGALAILDFFLDDMFPESLGKPLFGPAQPRIGGLGY